MPALSSSRSFRKRRSGSSFRRSSSGSTEWVGSVSMITLTWDTVAWVAFPLVSNEQIKTMTSPTYLGGFYDILVTAIDVPPAVPPAQGSWAFGVRPMAQRTFEAALAAPLAGAAPIPLPFQDSEASWAVWRAGYVSTAGNDLAASATNAWSDLSLVREHLVSRSARKLTEDDALVGVVEVFGNSALPPTGNICFHIATRLLVRQA